MACHPCEWDWTHIWIPYGWVMSHMCTPCEWYVTICEWVMSHSSHLHPYDETCHTYVTHVNGSCHPCEWDRSHIWIPYECVMAHVCNPFEWCVTHVNGSCHTYDSCIMIYHPCEWVMSHVCNPCEWHVTHVSVMSPVWMRLVTYMNPICMGHVTHVQPIWMVCYPCEWVMFQIGYPYDWVMSHMCNPCSCPTCVTHECEWYVTHMGEWVMSRIWNPYYDESPMWMSHVSRM